MLETLSTNKVEDDAHLSLIEHGPWTCRTNRQLPQRFQDVLPQPATSLPPPSTEISSSSISSAQIQQENHFTSSCNSFGLFWRYAIDDLPLHDPGAQLSLDQLSNPTPFKPWSRSIQNPYSPYPNQSSFMLGDWFWNGGVQKSHSSLNTLIDIITHPNFNITGLWDVRWESVNADLAGDSDGEWLDAGWTCTPISLSVPYQTRRGERCTSDAGPWNYVVGDFYHQKLTSIICEKITGLTENSQFHFAPYELLWKRSQDSPPVHIQGELYTSPAFIDTHRELQESPREPGCQLPQVVVALMFVSDAIQLTTFGTGKLWPGYMYFGNDTKYHWCKPTCHLCEHIAYFQSVSSGHTFLQCTESNKL